MVECRRFAVGILMIYVIVSEILLLPVSWMPSWISSTQRRPTISEVPLLESLSPPKKKTAVAVGILSLCALELEICLRVFYSPPVAGKRRKKAVAERRIKLLTILPATMIVLPVTWDVDVRQKSNMAAKLPELPITLLVLQIHMSF